MKLRVLVSSLLTIVILVVFVAIGITRGQGLGERVYDAYSTPSIDSFLGTSISIEGDACKAIENRVKQLLLGSSAPKELDLILGRLNSTLDNKGKITLDSYAWFKDEKFTSRIDFPSTSLPRAIRSFLNFDPDQITSEGVGEFSKRDLDKRLTDLRSRGQLPSRVDSDGWYGPFEEKYLEACSESLVPVVESVTGTFDSNVSELSSKMRTILSDDWVSPGFTKIGHLVAYNPNNPSSCSGFSGCAIFWVETATPCELKVTVGFSNSSNQLVGVRSATKRIAQANTRTTMQVSSFSANSRGFYEITDAKCK
jgi:hypothetical protein